MIDDFASNLEDFQKDLQELSNLLSIESKKKEVSSLQLQMAENSFWDNQKQAQRAVEQLKMLKDDVDTWSSLTEKVRDCQNGRKFLFAPFGQTLTKKK